MLKQIYLIGLKNQYDINVFPDNILDIDPDILDSTSIIIFYLTTVNTFLQKLIIN